MGYKKGYGVDHINRNKLDNRKSNLRFLDRSGNNLNRKTTKGNTGYVGVYYDKKQKDYQSHITINYKKIHLGRFKKLSDALIVRENYFKEIMAKKEKEAN